MFFLYALFHHNFIFIFLYLISFYLIYSTLYNEKIIKINFTFYYNYMFYKYLINILIGTILLIFMLCDINLIISYFFTFYIIFYSLGDCVRIYLNYNPKFIEKIIFNFIFGSIFTSFFSYIFYLIFKIDIYYVYYIISFIIFNVYLLFKNKFNLLLQLKSHVIIFKYIEFIYFLVIFLYYFYGFYLFKDILYISSIDSVTHLRYTKLLMQNPHLYNKFIYVFYHLLCMTFINISNIGDFTFLFLFNLLNIYIVFSLYAFSSSLFNKNYQQIIFNFFTLVFSGCSWIYYFKKIGSGLSYETILKIINSNSYSFSNNTIFNYLGFQPFTYSIIIMLYILTLSFEKKIKIKIKNILFFIMFTGIYFNHNPEMMIIISIYATYLLITSQKDNLIFVAFISSLFMLLNLFIMKFIFKYINYSIYHYISYSSGIIIYIIYLLYNKYGIVASKLYDLITKIIMKYKIILILLNTVFLIYWYQLSDVFTTSMLNKKLYIPFPFYSMLLGIPLYFIYLYDFRKKDKKDILMFTFIIICILIGRSFTFINLNITNTNYFEIRFLPYIFIGCTYFMTKHLNYFILSNKKNISIILILIFVIGTISTFFKMDYWNNLTTNAAIRISEDEHDFISSMANKLNNSQIFAISAESRKRLSYSGAPFIAYSKSYSLFSSNTVEGYYINKYLDNNIDNYVYVNDVDEHIITNHYADSILYKKTISKNLYNYTKYKLYDLLNNSYPSFKSNVTLYYPQYYDSDYKYKINNLLTKKYYNYTISSDFNSSDLVIVPFDLMDLNKPIYEYRFNKDFNEKIKINNTNFLIDEGTIIINFMPYKVQNSHIIYRGDGDGYGGNSEWHISLDDSSNIRFYIGSYNVNEKYIDVSCGNYLINQINTIVVTYNENEIIDIYMNGILEKSIKYPKINIKSFSNNTFIGGGNTDIRKFNGYIENIDFYDVKLSINDVLLKLYNNDIVKCKSNIIILYDSLYIDKILKLLFDLEEKYGYDIKYKNKYIYLSGKNNDIYLYDMKEDLLYYNLETNNDLKKYITDFEEVNFKLWFHNLKGTGKIQIISDEISGPFIFPVYTNVDDSKLRLVDIYSDHELILLSNKIEILESDSGFYTKLLLENVTVYSNNDHMFTLKSYKNGTICLEKVKTINIPDEFIVYVRLPKIIINGYVEISDLWSKSDLGTLYNLYGPGNLINLDGNLIIDKILICDYYKYVSSFKYDGEIDINSKYFLIINYLDGLYGYLFIIMFLYLILVVIKYD